MKNVKFIFSAIFILSFFEAFSQTSPPLVCGMSDCIDELHQESSMQKISGLSSFNKYYDFYNEDMSFWKPNNDDETKFIKVNLIVNQKIGNSPQNFSINGSRNGIPDTVYLHNLITSINEIYANLNDPSDNGGEEICGPCNQIKNSKIQFSLERIIFNYNGLFTHHNPSDEINIFLTVDDYNYSWCSGYSSCFTTNYMNSNIYVVMNRVYYKYIDNDDYTPIHLLAHELGHALGLCHTYFGGGCPTTTQLMYNSGFYFDDHFGEYPGKSPDRAPLWNSNPYLSNSDSITNNIMSNNIHRHYWTPKQIGAMQRNLAFNNTRKYLKNDAWNSTPFTVNSEELWDFSIRLDRDIHINDSGSLSLTNELQMPSNGKIEINDGGVLHINYAKVNSCTSENWGGITVKNGGLLILDSVIISDYNIQIDSGGTIILKNGLTINGDNYIAINAGGYYCFDVDSNSITLTDTLSVIIIQEGALIGINPVVDYQSDCSLDLSSIITNGEGQIIDFNTDLFIQNVIIQTNRFYGGKNIFIGKNVTSTILEGDVIISNNSHVVFKANTIIFEDGFECTLGSTFETTK